MNLAPPSEEQRDLFDSLESDTASLRQEERTCVRAEGVCDSLEEFTLLEKLTAAEDVAEVPRPCINDDYADLRYDPNWRKRLGCTNNLIGGIRAQLTQELLQISEEGLGKDVSGEEYIHYDISQHPPANILISECPSSPFHLHPPQQHSTDTYLEVADLSDSQKKLSIKNQIPSSGPFRQSSGKEISVQCGQEHVIPSQDDSANRSVKQYQKTFTHSKQYSTHSSKSKPARPRNDIVERNRLTLGINKTKKDSYLSLHRQQEDKQKATEKVCESPAESSSTGSLESRDDILDPELMWQQQTQQLKIQDHGETELHQKGARAKTRSHTREGRKYLSPGMDPPSGRKKHPHAAEAPLIDESGTVSTSATPPPQPEHFPPAHGSPTANLNINVNAPAEPPPFLNRSRQENVLAQPSPKAPPWRGRPGLYNPSPFIGARHTHGLQPPRDAAERPSVVPQAAAMLHISSPLADTGRQRRMKLLPQVYGQEDTSPRHLRRVLNPDPAEEDPALPNDQFRSPGRPSDAQSPGSYVVLPPIGRSSPGCPEGYLAQMDKKANYKVYSLQDYRHIKQEVRLGGLGPNNTVAEATAENIRRQKLYSNVIREQNKKISRIPFLPASSPASGGNGDTVPRIKALEYARTIARPKVRPHPTEEQRGKGGVFCDDGTYPPEQDLSQLAVLESLWKRHKEEKQAVAQFRAQAV
ncbi:jhy protein homolog [Denticeps clupeoides]|uniref:Uncharacterized protein n=1 Tax=Denticeps clupeoides TaxID=299321 RepID=A0AAY4B009_9TELE|nr:jhy protein homolog [Denticeps clupeoides]